MILLSYLVSACNSKNDHKNNDTTVKSVSTIISSSRFRPSLTIAENIRQDTSFSIFADLLTSSGFMEILTKQGPFTVFAPSNRAFRQVPATTLENWKDQGRKELQNILSYHLVAGSLYKNNLGKNQRLKTFANDELIIRKRNNGALVNGIKINLPAIQNSNGVIYQIDDLLYPKNDQ